jgi:hypothetical protein
MTDFKLLRQMPELLIPKDLIEFISTSLSGSDYITRCNQNLILELFYFFDHHAIPNELLKHHHPDNPHTLFYMSKECRQTCLTFFREWIPIILEVGGESITPLYCRNGQLTKALREFYVVSELKGPARQPIPGKPTVVRGKIKHCDFWKLFLEFCPNISDYPEIDIEYSIDMSEDE